ncbi:hypothetical protein BDF20DRAFT_914695 [Mycotypha africana]|uniref:uncharacterized protein n=1 Tax=Mycotypha africana TaxID=64632 RepID=UPI002301FBD8|nr:uncharacterized protein BDF20DRAFT_914695 [Mycotypha africana]KAI8973219.1 hypothetical protein BDF20DRAFT_914695 [Mycotypha africana]
MADNNNKNAELKRKLEQHQYTPEENMVMRSAMFNFVTLTSVGAASLGLAARLLAKSRRVPTGFFTFAGTLLGMGCGASLGTDRALHKIETSLPPDSLLLEFFSKNKKLNSKKKDEDVFNTDIVNTRNDTTSPNGVGSSKESSNDKISEEFLSDDTVESLSIPPEQSFQNQAKEN